MDIIKNASENIVNRLTWHTAVRDQAGIADELANEEEVQEIFGLDDVTLFDEFFCFLRELNIMKALEQLAPRNHRVRKSPVPFFGGYAHLFNTYCSRVEVFLPYWICFTEISIHYAHGRF